MGGLSAVASKYLGGAAIRGRAVLESTFQLTVLIAMLAGAVDVVWVAGRLGGAGATAVFSDLAMVVAALFAAVGCLRAASRRSSRRGSVSWSLLGLGMLAWGIGQAIWTWYEVAFGREVPYPSVADIGFLAMVPLALVGMAAMVSARDGAIRGLLDGLIIGGSLLIVSWATVLGPLYHTGGQSVLNWSVGLAYPLGDIALGTMALILLSQGGRPGRVPLILLGVGALGLTIADSGFVYLTRTDSYHTGNLIDIGWSLGFLLIGLAGLTAARSSVPAPARRATPIGTALPYLPLTLAIGTSAVVTLARGTVDPPLFLLGIMLVGLVGVRQMLTARENRVLNLRLAATITDLRRREEELRSLAYFDPLTGLANRPSFYGRAEEALLRGRQVALLYIDLDNFKEINDRLGHAVGDAVLAAVADHLRSSVPATDIVARLGGDEFVVLTEASEESASALAERITAAVGEPVHIGQHQVRVRASIGTAVAHGPYTTIETLLHQADRAMYAAKPCDGDGGPKVWLPAVPFAAEAAHEL